MRLGRRSVFQHRRCPLVKVWTFLGCFFLHGSCGTVEDPSAPWAALGCGFFFDFAFGFGLANCELPIANCFFAYLVFLPFAIFGRRLRTRSISSSVQACKLALEDRGGGDLALLNIAAQGLDSQAEFFGCFSAGTFRGSVS